MIEHSIIKVGSFHCSALSFDPGDECVENLGNEPVAFMLLSGEVLLNGLSPRRWGTTTLSGAVRIKATERSIVARWTVAAKDAVRLG